MDSAAVTPDAPFRPSGTRHAAAWFAGLLLLVPSLVAACRAADTDGITPVPQLLAFLPWLLLPAGAALLLAVLGRWRTGMVWAIAVLAVTGWYVRPYDTGLTDNPPGPVVARLTVLTSNVEFGNATGELLAAIRREEPDLVFVQECDPACSEALAAELSPADYPHRNVVEGDAASGSAILSKHPLRPAPGIPTRLAMPGSTAVVGGREDRQINLQLAHPLPPIPNGVDDWQQDLRQVRTYAEGAATTDRPTLIAGDFNATQDHAAFRRVLDAGGLRDSATLAGAAHTPTWPTSVRRPLGTQIDHVLISKEFSVREVRFLELDNTDHRSLLVELELHDAR